VSEQEKKKEEGKAGAILKRDRGTDPSKGKGSQVMGEKRTNDVEKGRLILLMTRPRLKFEESGGGSQEKLSSDVRKKRQERDRRTPKNRPNTQLPQRKDQEPREEKTSIT